LALLDGLPAKPGDASAGGLDLHDCSLRESVRRHREALREIAHTENLDVNGDLADEPRGLERLRGHLGARIEARLEVGDVHRLTVRPERPDRHRVRGRVPAKLAETHVDRHLAALEARRHLLRTGPRLLALDPAARVPTFAGTQAAADALPRLACLGRLQVRE